MSDPNIPTTITAFELSSSPAGLLASFQADDDFAELIGDAPPGTVARCMRLGTALIVDLAGLAIILDARGAQFTGWPREGAKTYLCAFNARFPQGAAAFEMAWSSQA